MGVTGSTAAQMDERLFDLLDDLKRQAEALYAAERDAGELADRSRAESPRSPWPAG